MSHPKRRRILQISLIVLSITFIAAGIVRLEVLDVIANAKIVCYSCIGLK